MENKLNFTTQMKETIREWKGKRLKSFVENSDDGCLSIVRFFIEDRAFDLDNEYVSYEYPNNERVELSRFACVEADKTKTLQPHVVSGNCKEYIVDETILNVYIVKDKECGRLFDSGCPYELDFDTALMIQTEKRYYVFWRNLIFYTIEVAICKDKEEALKTMKSVEKIREEAQEGNPYAVAVERSVEQL